MSTDRPDDEPTIPLRDAEAGAPEDPPGGPAADRPPPGGTGSTGGEPTAEVPASRPAPGGSDHGGDPAAGAAPGGSSRGPAGGSTAAGAPAAEPGEGGTPAAEPGAGGAPAAEPGEGGTPAAEPGAGGAPPPLPPPPVPPPPPDLGTGGPASEGPGGPGAPGGPAAGPPPSGDVPPPPPPTGPGATPTGGGAAAPGTVLRRSADDRVLAGVCGGIAAYLGVDPVVVRIAFVVFSFVWGWGLLVYAIAWIAIPEQRPGEVLGRGEHARDPAAASLVVGGLLVLAGVFLLADRLVPSLGRFLWPLVLIGVGVAVVVGSRR